MSFSNTQYNTVRERLQNTVCEVLFRSGTCKNKSCTKVHSLEELKKLDQCIYNSKCSVDGCPFVHVNPKISWADIDDEDDDSLLSYSDLLKIQKNESIRSASPSFSTMTEVLQDFDLSLSTLLPKQMKTYDCEDDLSLYHVQRVDNESSEQDRAIRGIITGDEGILVKSFPFVREITVEHPRFSEWVSQELTPGRLILKSYEGSLLRVWYYPVDQTWRISTIRKIDAFKSKWNGSSYGERFVDSIRVQQPETFKEVNEESILTNQKEKGQKEMEISKFYFDHFCKQLNTDFIYTFWLTNDTKTKIICSTDSQRVYSMGRFNRSRRFEYSIFTFKGIPYPPRINSLVASAEDLASAITDPQNSELNDLKIQGYTILSPEGRLFKVSSIQYSQMNAIRGPNAPNKFVKYLEMYQHPGASIFTDVLYPEEKERFCQLSDKMDKYLTILFKIHNLDVKNKRLPFLNKDVFKSYRKFRDSVEKKPMSKEEIKNHLLVMIRDNMEFGLDVLRVLEPSIEMLPTPDQPTAIPESESHYPVSVKFGSFQYNKPRQNIRNSPKEVIMPSPTLSPSTTPISSPSVSPTGSKWATDSPSPRFADKVPTSKLFRSYSNTATLIKPVAITK